MSKQLPSKHNGTQRAAIFLLSLGEQEAAAVLKHMDAKDVQRIGGAMTQLQNISRQDVSGILSEVSVAVESHSSFGAALGADVDEYLRKVLIGALGEDKASGLIDRILLGRSNKGLETMKWMDARAIAKIMRVEHPQIVAIVLAYLDSAQSAEVIAQFPQWLRTDVIMRIATLDGIAPIALHELNASIEKNIAGKTGALQTSVMGGVKTAANILHCLETGQGSALLESICKVDNALGASIRDLTAETGTVQSE